MEDYNKNRFKINLILFFLTQLYSTTIKTNNTSCYLVITVILNRYICWSTTYSILPMGNSLFYLRDKLSSCSASCTTMYFPEAKQTHTIDAYDTTMSAADRLSGVSPHRLQQDVSDLFSAAIVTPQSFWKPVQHWNSGCDLIGSGRCCLCHRKCICVAVFKTAA